METCGETTPRARKVRGYMANFRPFFAHITPQFSQETLIHPRSFPARGHTFVVKPLITNNETGPTPLRVSPVVSAVI